jgi:hypothetical protein
VDTLLPLKCSQMCVFLMNQARLPSGSNATVLSAITDRYGASTQYPIRAISVTVPSANELASVLSQLSSRLTGATNISSALFYDALLIAAGKLWPEGFDTHRRFGKRTKSAHK